MVYPITREGSVFSLKETPWAGYCNVPPTRVTLAYDEEGLTVFFVCEEQNPRAEKTRHNTAVCCDSCMELFLQPAPRTDPHYINIEINPRGTVYCAVRTCREDGVLMDEEAIAELKVETRVLPDRWEIRYRLEAEWIRRYVPDYRHERGQILRANMYKCGDETPCPHYGAFAAIAWEQPDFHRPEFFAEFVLA